MEDGGGVTIAGIGVGSKLSTRAISTATRCGTGKLATNGS